MSAAAVVAVAVTVFLYIEAAIGTGYYMYLITRKNTDDTKIEEHKQLKKLLKLFFLHMKSVSNYILQKLFY